MQSSHVVAVLSLYPRSLSLLAARGPIAGPAPNNRVIFLHPAGLYEVQSALVNFKPMLDYTSNQSTLLSMARTLAIQQYLPFMTAGRSELVVGTQSTRISVPLYTRIRNHARISIAHQNRMDWEQPALVRLRMFEISWAISLKSSEVQVVKRSAASIAIRSSMRLYLVWHSTGLQGKVSSMQQGCAFEVSMRFTRSVRLTLVWVR